MTARNLARAARLAVCRGVAHQSVVQLLPGQTAAEALALLVADGRIVANRCVLMVPPVVSEEEWSRQAAATQARLAAEAAAHWQANHVREPEQEPAPETETQPAAPIIPAWKREENEGRKRQRYGTKDMIFS
jgi:hypothetical protein